MVNGYTLCNIQYKCFVLYSICIIQYILYTLYSLPVRCKRYSVLRYMKTKNAFHIQFVTTGVVSTANWVEIGFSAESIKCNFVGAYDKSAVELYYLYFLQKQLPEKITRALCDN